MEKHLLKIEYRYHEVPRYERDSGYCSKTVTIGIYDTFEEACEKGNEQLKYLESKFKIHVFPDGREATKERFSKNGGCFGSKKNLITNLAYLKTPFHFFFQIKTLNYGTIEESSDKVVKDVESYKKYKKDLERQ